MKSIRLLSAVFIVIAFANVRAAGTPKPSAKASPSASPSATPDKSGLPDPVAIVEGKKIKRAELEAAFAAQLDRLAKAGQPVDSLTPDQIQIGYHSVLNNMIIERLLKERSANVKITNDELAKRLQQFKDDNQFSGTDEQLAAVLKKIGQTLDGLKDHLRLEMQEQKWIDSQLGDKIKVTDAEAKSYYDKNPDQFSEPKSIRVSHILIMVPADATPAVAAEKEKLAKATKERITKGEDFAKVASEVSEDSGSKDNGGDMVRYIHQGDMSDSLPEFEAAAFKLKKGEVSDPVRTKLGWHIIKVTDIKDARTIAYASIKDEIIEHLKEDKEEKPENDFLEDLLAKNAKILLKPLPKAPPAQEEQAPEDHGSMAPAPGADSQPPANQQAPAKELGAP